MSTCISSHGEYSDHIPDDSYVCTRCSVLDEDAMLTELKRLRSQLAEAEEVMADYSKAVEQPSARCERADEQLAELRVRVAELEAENGALSDAVEPPGECDPSCDCSDHRSPRNCLCHVTGAEAREWIRREEARADALEAQRDKVLDSCDQVERLLSALGHGTSSFRLSSQIRAVYAEPPEIDAGSPTLQYMLISHGYTGHGHRCCKKAPTERPAGYRSTARCGGPGMCEQCAADRDELHAAPSGPVTLAPAPDSHVAPTNSQTWERDGCACSSTRHAPGESTEFHNDADCPIHGEHCGSESQGPVPGQPSTQTWEQQLAEMSEYAKRLSDQIVRAIGILDDAGNCFHPLYSSGVGPVLNALYAVLEPGSKHVCRAEYKSPGVVDPNLHTRIVRCLLDAGHEGEHEEVDTGNRWPSTDPPPLTELIGLDPNFTGGLSASDHLARQYGGMTAAERAVIDAARKAADDIRGLSVAKSAPARALVAAVDALDAAPSVEPSAVDGTAPTWRDYSIEHNASFDIYDTAIVCRSDGGCEWTTLEADLPREGRYLTLGEAMDAAQEHVRWHAELDASAVGRDGQVAE